MKVVMNRCPKIEYGRLSSRDRLDRRSIRAPCPRSAPCWAAACSGCRSTAPRSRAARRSGARTPAFARHDAERRCIAVAAALTAAPLFDDNARHPGRFRDTSRSPLTLIKDRPMTETHSRLCHACHPRRRAARPDDRRARDADLPDDLLRLRRRRPRRLALRPAGLRQHLHPHREPDQGGAGGARRGTRGRHGGARGRVRPRRAGRWSSMRCCSRATSSSRRSKLYGGSINQFSHAFKSFGWNVVWADPDDISTFEARGLAARPRRSSSS